MNTRLRRVCATVLSTLVAGAVVAPFGVAHADSYVPISGSGSTWSFNAIDQWRRDVQQYGMRINFAANGSSAGRQDFANRSVEFAVSEIQYGLKDNGNVDPPPQRPFGYMPIVAGGTSFMYNLNIGGRRVTDLRLSGGTLAKIFTGVVTNWSDPAIKADNPGLALPARKIVPVVRSDGSGTTAQFTRYLASQYPDVWNAYCRKAGLASPCGLTSNFPVVAGLGFVASSGSLGVSQYTAQAQNEGTITYVEYSYARELGFPVVKVENAAHYYVLPTSQNVAVALLQAQINNDKTSPDYLTQILDKVYADTDPRAYPLSSYSYMIVPTSLDAPLTPEKGRTLGAFAYYFLCQGQQTMDDLGYSPLPINLVKAGLDQVRKIPGVDVQTVDIAKCNNPTFSADGTNTLAKAAPQPAACDKEGPTQCVLGAATGQGSGPAGGGSSGGGATGGGAAGGGSNGAGGSAGGTAGVPATRGSASPPATVGVGGTVNGGQSAAVDPDLQGQAPGSTVAANVAQSVPVTLGADGSFGESRGMVAIAALLLVALVVVPPAVARVLRPGNRS